MWILLPTAFVSVVQHRTQPATLIVRARRRDDLRVFLGPALSRKFRIRATPDADYPFRVLLPRRAVAARAAWAATQVRYDNVKNAIPETDTGRKAAMSAVWSTLLSLEPMRRPVRSLATDFRDHLRRARELNLIP